MNGITRRKTLELARENGIPAYERNFSLVDVYGADEAFLTGTFAGQTPVREIDGRAIGDGGAGPVTRRLQALYRDLVARDVGAA
jgi:branched-chain amino acid aminotransferase